MKCHNCEYAPKNYEEYCKAQRYEESDKLCPDAFEPRANYCNQVVNKNVNNKETTDEN